MEARGSKTLVAGDPVKQPSWLVWTLMKVFRIVLLTILWGGLGMGVGLFSGIIGLLVRSLVVHATPDMSLAYRYVSIPLALTTGSCALLWNLVRTVQAAAKRHKEMAAQ
jgi:hypothetical protein